ncbi:MAG: C40 family peptidase [Spirochaetaceae bacterium]|jgi:cell wall-associated NlpC family hydrolase|nr:C40 family peptidase [Spirochaetaceae bacterium]
MNTKKSLCVTWLVCWFILIVPSVFANDSLKAIDDSFRAIDDSLTTIDELSKALNDDLEALDQRLKALNDELKARNERPQAMDERLRQAIIETAKQYQGVSYRYGAESPKGFDCSGFVRYVYRTAAGIELPRTSKTINAAGQSVGITEAKEGDVVVFASQGVVNHVAILLDEDSVIHAVSLGPKTGVIISSLEDRYFGPRIIGARSFLQPLE